ncbi:MAG TPA: hypothetical protein VFZ69_09220 [Longimicrobiales bacterium]
MDTQPRPPWLLRPVPERVPLHAALVFALAVLVYLPSIGNEFAYDDVPIVQLNERVRQFDVAGLLTSGYWQDSTSALYRPLASLSYAADWRLSGGSPGWFHFTNVMWHGAVSVLLLVLLRALRGPPAAALAGAVVFAVHPVHVEAVANIVGRAELMAAAFTLGAALLFARPPETLRRPAPLAVTGVLFALALLSKEGAVVTPALLAVTDIGLGRLRPGAVTAWLRDRMPVLAVLVAVLLLYLIVRTAVLGAITPTDLDPSLELLRSPLHRFLTALQAWPQYARLLFFPRVLLADYGPRILMPATAASTQVLAGAGLLVACIATASAAWLTGRPRAAAALLWFPVAIVAVSNLFVPIGVLVAERTLYLPSAALSIGVVAAATALTGERRTWRARAALAGAVGLVLGLLAVRTVIRIPDWRTTNTIFFALTTDRPDAFRGRWHLARLAASRGEPESAMRLHAEAIELWPYRPRLLREAVIYAAQNGRPDWSKQVAGFALQQFPRDLVIRRVYAALLLDQADTVAARIQIREGLLWHPQDSLLLKMQDAATPVTPSHGLADS